jgi:hypothetical protein
LATSISFDGDHIILGDAYRNLTILKKTDEEENKREKVDSDENNVKKVMSNKIEAHVIGAHSLNRELSLNEIDRHAKHMQRYKSLLAVKQLTDVEKKLFSVVSVSLDGYARLFKVRDGKNFRVCSQINI